MVEARFREGQQKVKVGGEREEKLNVLIWKIKRRKIVKFLFRVYVS